MLWLSLEIGHTTVYEQCDHNRNPPLPGSTLARLALMDEMDGHCVD
jgi:hypothetical protein